MNVRRSGIIEKRTVCSSKIEVNDRSSISRQVCFMFCSHAHSNPLAPQRSFALLLLNEAPQTFGVVATNPIPEGETL